MRSAHITRARVATAVVLIALALLGWRVAASGGTPSAAMPAVAVRTHPVGSELPGMVVHVVGAVRRPGLYTLPGTARIAHAVRRAGGPTRHADLTALNLAAHPSDGQQIVVPSRNAAGAPGAAASSATTADAPVSLSQATAAQLEELDGIGPALAARIIEWRESHGGFASVDQLENVPGIGPARLEALRARVVP